MKTVTKRYQMFMHISYIIHEYFFLYFPKIDQLDYINNAIVNLFSLITPTKTCMSNRGVSCIWKNESNDFMQQAYLH